MAAKKQVKKRTTRQSVPRKSTRGKIWVMAVDPFSELDFQPTWNLVKPLAEHAGARVQAAYVLAPASMNWTGDFSGPWMKRYQPIAETKLQEMIPGMDVDRVIVPCKASGSTEAVKALVNHAKKIKADCIVIATHARKGFDRLTMGSFAESVILTSSVPVFVINPSQHLPTQVRKILVPTDMSKKSEKFLNQIAVYAKAQNAEIVLFHKQDDPVDPIVQQGIYTLGGGWVSVQSYMDDDLTKKTKRIEKIEKIIRGHDVMVSHIFDSSPEGLVESIEQAAKDTGADMVSVLTEAGSWSSAILGSVARGLVRHSPVPVLVQR